MIVMVAIVVVIIGVLMHCGMMFHLARIVMLTTFSQKIAQPAPNAEHVHSQHRQPEGRKHYFSRYVAFCSHLNKQLQKC